MNKGSALKVEADIVRTYVEAVRQVIGPLVDRNDEAGETARLLLTLAEATVSCADSVARTWDDMMKIVALLDIIKPTEIPPPNTLSVKPNVPVLTVVAGGKP